MSKVIFSLELPQLNNKYVSVYSYCINNKVIEEVETYTRPARLIKMLVFFFSYAQSYLKFIHHTVFGVPNNRV